MNVRQYQRYATCKADAATGDKIAPKATPKGDKLCEPGITAFDIKTELVVRCSLNR